MDGPASDPLHHPSFRNREERRHLAGAVDWYRTPRHALVLAHVLSLVHVVKIVDQAPPEKIGHLHSSGANHFQKSLRVKKPTSERNIMVKIKNVTIYSFREIKTSLSWNSAHHHYCTCAPNWFVFWHWSFFFEISVLAPLHYLLPLQALLVVPRTIPRPLLRWRRRPLLSSPVSFLILLALTSIQLETLCTAQFLNFFICPVFAFGDQRRQTCTSKSHLRSPPAIVWSKTVQKENPVVGTVQKYRQGYLALKSERTLTHFTWLSYTS